MPKNYPLVIICQYNDNKWRGPYKKVEIETEMLFMMLKIVLEIGNHENIIDSQFF